MPIKNQDIICDHCIDSLHSDDESVGKYINIDDFSERQLNHCVVCYECEHIIWSGEDCKNCKVCNSDWDYGFTFAKG